MKVHTRETVEFEFDSWTVTTADDPVLRSPGPAGTPAPGGGGGHAIGRATIAAAAAAVALVLVLAAAAVVDLQDGAAGEGTTGAASEAADPTGPELVVLPPAVAAPLPYPGGRIDAGRYTTDVLGIPVEFTVDDPTALRTARPGRMLLTPGGTSEPRLEGAPHVQFVRLAGWNTREEAVDVGFRGVGSIAAGDVEAWIAANDVVVDAQRERLVDGRRTRVFDLHVDPASPLGDGACRAEVRPCFWFASVPPAWVPDAAVRLDELLYGGMAIRFWVIDTDGPLPVLIQAAVPAGLEAWLDRFEATTIDTIRFG